MQEVIDRYKRHTKDRVQPENQADAQNLQHMQHEAAILMKKIELLEISKRKFLGEGLQSCTLQEIQQIEKQLERSVSTIRARKTQVFKEQVERLKEKEKILTAENAKLREKFVGLQQNQTPSEDKEGEAVCTDSSEKSDVETELIIGPPESRTRRLLQN
ncbi:MADS-box protein SOC1 [Capsicum annuum]|uniref:MADS-box protein SOC1 n=2 Tax=Capsicum annuum TaxID=4072 RepID=A0A2G3AGW1_CAPAN|nr:MADS-box protein SOC1 [Capsicum annuum]